MIPNQQPAPTAGAPAPAAPQATAPAGAPQGRQVDPLSFIKEVYELLLVRIEAAGQQNPNFGQAFESGVSPEGLQELFQILPEMKVIFDAIQAGSGGGGVPAGQGPIRPAAPPNGNPLTADPNMGGVSRGLVG